MRRVLMCVLAAAFCAGLGGCARKAKGPAESSGLSYVPADATAVAVVNVKQIMESKLLQPVLQDQMVAEQLKQLPIDLRKIESATVAGSPRKGEAKPWQPPLSPVAVIRFTEPTDAKAMIEKIAPPGRVKFEERSHQGKTYYTADRDNFFFQPDEKTVVVAEQEETLKGLLSGAAKSPIVAKLQAAGTGDDLVGVVLVEPLRGLIGDARRQLPGKTMPGLDKLASVPDQLKSATLTVNLSSATLARLVLECTSAESGQKVNDTLKKGLDVAKPVLGMLIMLGKKSEDTPPVAKEGLDVLGRLVLGLQVTQSGDQVVVTAPKPEGLDKLVASLPAALHEAEGAGQEAARRVMRLNNLKQIALAMLNYENSHNGFPPAAICDKQGKPLLSWRVAILPFIDEKPLYDQFRLDEPWDGPNNNKLVNLMPLVYQGQRTERDGKTTIVVFTGKDAPFDEGKKLAIADIIDGVSSTIMAVEAGEDKAVPWTRPEDLPFDPQNPRAALGNIAPTGFLGVMFDCSAHVFKSDMSAETLGRLINPRDKQPVDMSEAEASPGARVRMAPGLKGSTRGRTVAPPFKKP